VYTVKFYGKGKNEVMICDDTPKGQSHLSIHKSGDVQWVMPQDVANEFDITPQNRRNGRRELGVCPETGGRVMLHLLLPHDCATNTTTSRTNKLEIIDVSKSDYSCVVISFIETRGININLDCMHKAALAEMKIPCVNGKSLKVVGVFFHIDVAGTSYFVDMRGADYIEPYSTKNKHRVIEGSQRKYLDVNNNEFIAPTVTTRRRYREEK